MSGNENNSKWKITSHTLPIAYIILICIGYLIKSIYYEKFGIEIALYLNFQEYLFIFLPIGSGIVMVALIFSIYILALLGVSFALYGHTNFTKIFTSIETSNERSKSKKKSSPPKFKKAKRILANFLFAVIIIAPIGVILYFSITEKIFGVENSIDDLIVFSVFVIWALVLFILMLVISFIRNEDKRSSFLLYSSMMTIIISFVWHGQLFNADRILSGKSKTIVSFKKDNHVVTTNDSIAFIGQTKEYLFLRNLKDNGNLIYQKDNLEEIKIIK